MEHYLIYVSTANHLMSESELMNILEESRRWNLDHDLTGMLIYIQGLFIQTGPLQLQQQITGRFMQIIEGSTENVEEVFSMIQKDDRHHNLIVLESSSQLARNFESWQMGFRALQLNESEFDDTYFNLDDSFVKSRQEESSNRPLHFLKSFYQRGKSQSTVFFDK